MKKQGIFVLVLITGIFAAFVTGLFIGRNLYRQRLSVEDIQIVTSQQTAAIQPDQDHGDRINVNTATTEELMTLPGIGQVLAERIVEYRQTNGPFSTIADMLEVEGIGESKLDGLLDYVTVGG